MLGITRPYLSNGKRAFYSIISYTCFQISSAAHDSLILIISISLRFMLTWFAFHWNAVWKCSFQWMIHPINPCFQISFAAHDSLTHPDTPFDWINHLWSRRCSPLLPWYLSNMSLKTMEFEWNHSKAVLTRFQHELEYFIVFHMKSR